MTDRRVLVCVWAALLALALAAGYAVWGQRHRTGTPFVGTPFRMVSPSPAPPPAIFAAIRAVESGGDDRAVGRRSERGPYQITRAYWQDGCEALGVSWRYDDHVESRPHCEAVMGGYWKRYGAVTDEQKARMHNGGPRGHRKAATLAYWRKVKAIMEAD